MVTTLLAKSLVDLSFGGAFPEEWGGVKLPETAIKH